MAVYLYYQTNTNTTAMTTSTVISKRFAELVNDPNFIKLCIECSKKVGLSAYEWNTNKAAIIAMYALKAIELDMQQN